MTEIKRNINVLKLCAHHGIQNKTEVIACAMFARCFLMLNEGL